jgi:beta-glucosidase
MESDPAFTTSRAKSHVELPLGRMYHSGREIRMSLARLALYIIVIAAFFAGARTVPLAADRAADQASQGAVDSQAFLQSHMTPAGPAASTFVPAVEKLLAQMTLQEKVGQMTQLTIATVVDGKDRDIRINPEKLHKAIGEYGVGSILNVSDQALPVEKWLEILRAIQAAAKNTRLQIPVLYGIDSIHGTTYVEGGTLFPQPLAMAATWNPELMLRGSQISAAETRKAGIPWTFSPVLDVGRQPLWPRLYETFGEDTYLATVMGVATVRGYEGDDISSPVQVSSSLKHYVGYSFPTTGSDRSPALIPESALREYFLPTFAAAVRAGARTVMVNSADVNGTPGHANGYLLKTVLRDELGFQGVVVSDWQDIERLVTAHHVAATEKEATRIGILAGIDMSMVPLDYRFSDCLLQLVREGQVPEARINEAVRRILTLKYQLGLFTDPLRGIDSNVTLASPESRQASLTAAQESITLLKNEHQTLPLAKTAHVLVAGPDADSLIPLDNGWSYTWQGDKTSAYPTQGYATILGAIRQKIGADHVTYVPGAAFDKELDIAQAAAAARGSNVDAVVLCLGEWSYAETPGNIPDLALPDAQIHLAQKLFASGKPVILVLTEGRPRIIRPIVSGASAVLMAYNPGNEGGQAIADILFGDVNPSGKLPITYPRYANMLFTYDHKTLEGDEGTAAPLYAPQFEFGYGLSYTNYAYSDLQVTPSAGSGAQKIQVSVTVRNTGARAGKEVVQLYLNQQAASITPPLKRLRHFAKIQLQPDEMRRYTFELGSEDLSFINAENKRVVEPGLFHVQVGGLEQSFEWK